MESLSVTATTKEGLYKEILPQIEAVTGGETDTIANLANICAILKETFRFWWVGFYLVKPSAQAGREELVLGPFQGPLACTRIQYGKGVCGTAWKEGSTLIVPDVEQFPGHIACSSLSRSEIVVPLFDKNGKTVAVLDIDSEHLNTFDATDAVNLEKMAESLEISY